MPTNRRRRTRGREGVYIDGHRAVLLRGVHAVLDLDVDAPRFRLVNGNRYPDLDIDALRKAWIDDGLREELLPQFIEENPGHRPHAWHVFDAPEPRRAPQWYYDNIKAGMFYGDSLLGAVDPGVLEDETDYLERVGVLTNGEREQVNDCRDTATTGS